MPRCAGATRRSSSRSGSTAKERRLPIAQSSRRPSVASTRRTRFAKPFARAWTATQLDTLVPVQSARYVARAIPNCSPRFFPNEGHLLTFRHSEEILRTLVDANAQQ